MGLAVLLLAAGCSSSDNGGGGDPAGLTWNKDVRPLVELKCGACHMAGGIGPFALTSYEELASRRGEVQAAVAGRHMPPWPPAPGCTEYSDDRSMSDAEIDTIVKWYAAGAPRGNEADYKAPSRQTSGLSRVDMHLQMAVDYMPRKRPDDYRCFVIDWPSTSTTFVTGFRANPGNARIVHHVIAFLATPDLVATAQKLDAAEEGPGYTCFGTAGTGDATQWLGAWAPGGLGSDFPSGTGIRVMPGSKVILQVHYNTLTTAPEPDRTSVDFKIDQSVTQASIILPWTNPSWLRGKGMQIKAGDPDATHRFAYDPSPFLAFISDELQSNKPFTLWSASLHMHMLGTRGRLDLVRAGGARECLLDIPRWDFHWQGSYGLRQPRTFNPGDQLSIECHWDNTAANQPVGPDGNRLTPRDVQWGEGTTDEMCLGGFYISQAR